MISLLLENNPIHVFEIKLFEGVFSISSDKNLTPYIDPHPTPGYHNLNKLEFSLHEDASTQVKSFWLIGLWDKDFLSIYTYIECVPRHSGSTLQPGPCFE